MALGLCSAWLARRRLHGFRSAAGRDVTTIANRRLPRPEACSMRLRSELARRVRLVVCLFSLVELARLRWCASESVQLSHATGA